MQVTKREHCRLNGNNLPAKLEVLKSISPDDICLIIQGCLGSGSAQADYKAYIMVYELFVLKDKPLGEIAKLLKVTTGTIVHKIDRLVSLVKRELVIIDKLPPDADIFPMPITRLIMSDRTLHGLEKARVTTVGDLFGRGEKDLLRTRNVGRKTLNETNAVMRSLLAHLQRTHEASDIIKKLKDHSEEVTKGAAEWTRQEHELLIRILTDFQSQLSKTEKIPKKNNL